MKQTLARRGPDDSGIYIHEQFGFAHARLSIIDLTTGHQPMVKTFSQKDYAIVYNGELYNQKELKQDLIQKGYTFQTTSDTEIILSGYLEYGTAFVEKLNGIFAFAIADTKKKTAPSFSRQSRRKTSFLYQAKRHYHICFRIKRAFCLSRHRADCRSKRSK